MQLSVTALLIVGLSIHAMPLDAQAPPLDGARWLTGCWKSTLSGGRSTVERWEAQRDGAMLGASYAVAGSTIRENEQLRLSTIGGTLVYEAHPGNQARTAFRATRVTATELVFENRAHDFPKRISYRRTGRDSIVARIEGDRAGRRAPVTFAFGRVACGRVGPSAGGAARAALLPVYDAMAAAERREAGGRMRWVAAQVRPGYRFIIWTEPGSDVQVWDVDAVRLAASQQAAVARSLAPTGRRYDATVQRVRTRGDTAQALVEGRSIHRQGDPAGQHGPAGGTVERTLVQRWIDTWVRAGSGWRLARTEAVSEEEWIGGRLVTANGRSRE